ncbi:MAG: cobyrinate a,c-diamide synthase [Desulfobulbaceae bacterium]|nr:cobyrinate a,c-diamide synthase [Desulfobulbaceae bacterium]
MTRPTMAFMLAATGSGTGKTTLTLGLLAALHRQGLTVQPFKCGPDFIDPTLHQMVSGRVSRNLDLRMCGAPYVRNCFDRHRSNADIAVIEGVMGLFDGGIASPAALAKALRIPVLLLVDAKGCAESIAAVVKGFETLDPELALMGVIFNRVASPRHLELLRSAVQSHCRTPILGSLPRNQDFCIPDRHLGLLMGSENPLTEAQLDTLTAAVGEHIDLATIMRLATMPYPAARPVTPPKRQEHGERPRIGIARDQAFCFYYQDNLDLLESMGAELIQFSPMFDTKLPANIHGLYLGGGYPELHGESLSANTSLLAEIKAWAEAGQPIYAECGGFIYLCKGIVGLDGTFWPLAGVFPCRATMGKRLSRLGYREALINEPCLLGDAGQLFGHEFHYSEIDPMPASVKRVYQLQDGREEGYQIKNTLGGYLHLHFGRTPSAASHFIDLCQVRGSS